MKKTHLSSLVVLPAGLLFLGYCYLNVTVRDSYSGQWTSASAAQAKTKGLLLQEYVIEPHVVEYENYRVEFTDCWVEERTRTHHDFIFFEKVTKLGEPIFLFNYKGQRMAPDPDSAAEAMLVRGEEGHGVDLGSSMYAEKPFALAHHQYRDAVNGDGNGDGNDTLYFSIMRGWHDQRKYQVKAYPKPKALLR